MNTSTTDNTPETPRRSEQRGALADGLTLVRAVLGPIVAISIIMGWPSVAWACLASLLFALGALTDLFDDMLGGSQKSPGRIFGWFDDAADAFLIGFALLALLYVTHKAGVLGWAFAVPAVIYIARDIVLGLLKGFDFSKFGAPHSKIGDYKNALAMLGVSLMIASPWLQMLMDRFRAKGGDNVIEVYGTNSPWVWMIGQGILWIAALLALFTFVRHLRAPKLVNEA